MKKMICRMALVLAVIGQAGCGLKGPLYFPKQEQPQKNAGVKAPPKTNGGTARGAQQPSTSTDAEQQSAR